MDPSTHKNSNTGKTINIDRRSSQSVVLREIEMYRLNSNHRTQLPINKWLMFNSKTWKKTSKAAYKIVSQN